MKLLVILFCLVIFFFEENIGVKIYTNDSAIFDINKVLKSRLSVLYRKGNKLNNYFFSYIEKNGKKNKCYKYIQDALYDPNTQIMKREVFKCLNTSRDILSKTFHDVINKLFLYIKNVFIKKYFIFFLLYLININCESLVSQINDPYVLNNYNLSENASPALYNLKYEEVEIPIGAKIKGWLIKSNKKSNKLFLLLHGYNSNRQACLFFLNILKKLNVHHDTNIFIPDMKNFNEKGVEDIYNILIYFKDKMALNDVNVYTQSSTNLLVLLLSKHYKNKIVSKSKQKFINNIIPYSSDKKNSQEDVIYIDKYIFDSPILNLHRTINIHFKLHDIQKKINEEKMKANVDMNNLYDKKTVLSYFISFFMWLLNNQLKGHLYDFDFNKLVNENNINPANIYILHSLNDNISLLNILSQEVKENRLLPLKNIYIFKNGRHGNIYESSKKEYDLIVKRIIKGFNIFDFLYYIPMRSKMSSLSF
ncbi:conserved Plasmodium protein, unknown function [Plasmodium knowlesi strain H]|uniref:Alpha/beta hydrolase n=3 Tax=Plasmodium knowlesi TaxID=5850 RepID=A0A5K1UAT5_PLAKH|nr:uncharacterized protein PKNH_1406400 [Plasmodium knowlesi strain H]OTN63613.1 Uncharacterized protein PKNOH_S140223500 [Plasmodium knowlesi]CAA9990663.1 conserved protein, unknown function [Plasmodium knowlesi strain H]SBO25964.1 conserved Plasmodium protein, unknown function [Plasmodium knowlesi strain H]SBO28695.1 conserved Plasmodium protein, unknown function [Plasmodium knowlesi strain H]VVS80137.1 conserved protein, unknown function [Plasmodium knowlesi strain H]|eukprot:XP_002261954.1 [Plasmodium knowlesi strain H]